MSSFYSRQELDSIGFRKVGTENVLVSRKASIYSPEDIELGNYVRIDDFCILSGKIVIGDYVHIAAYCALFAGNYGIEMEDFTGISSRTVIYASSDDYSGNAMTNPMVDDKYRNVIGAPVVLKRHVIVGTGSSIMPGVIIGEGTAVGSMSLVNKSLDAWGIFAGIPCRKISNRSNKLLNLEKSFMQ